MSVYGKTHIMDPSSYTYSTNVNTWLAGQVRCHYQDSMASGWRTSKTTIGFITYVFKESADPRQVLIRTYLPLLRKSLFSMLGNGPNHTPVPLTFLTKHFILPDFSKTDFRRGKVRINSKVSQMFRKVYESFYVIVQKYIKVIKCCVKNMVKLLWNDVFTCFEVLSCASNMLSYGSITMIWLILLVYILMPL